MRLRSMSRRQGALSRSSSKSRSACEGGERSSKVRDSRSQYRKRTRRMKGQAQTEPHNNIGESIVYSVSISDEA
jgi:hypothetical protein